MSHTPDYMSFNNQILWEPELSHESINQQLQKMFLDTVFESSDILKRFLSFVVEQTLQGHSNQLKEYTIAVRILNKPANFNPQENGIVRIHAGRLRKALELYYRTSGVHDPIRISIPKGNYVPVFTDKPQANENDEIREPEKYSSAERIFSLAIMPFRQLANDNFKTSFAEALGLQLSDTLMRMDNFSVAGNYAMNKLSEKFKDIKSITNASCADYLITGDIQSSGSQLRVFMQMIRTDNGQLAWSQMYERKFYPADIFRIQDEIVKQAVAEIDFCINRKRKRLSAVSLVAVA